MEYTENMIIRYRYLSFSLTHTIFSQLREREHHRVKYIIISPHCQSCQVVRLQHDYSESSSFPNKLVLSPRLCNTGECYVRTPLGSYLPGASSLDNQQFYMDSKYM